MELISKITNEKKDQAYFFEFKPTQVSLCSQSPTVDWATIKLWTLHKQSENSPARDFMVDTSRHDFVVRTQCALQLQHQKEGKKLVGCLPLRMCSESAEEAKFATLQEYVPESAAEAIAK